ncbi:MAG: KpsF/GutQ family sugar-phosphate isomerase [Gemmatimonadales bacterium]|nr:KpsF/GutQ family sugar-phosphate isomerase [Gemmatimonadales bacterium]
MPVEAPARLDAAALIALGRRVLELEAASIHAAAGRLDARFARAVELLARSTGRVIVSGVGKSGLIARKLAATLTSTGTAASYLHPVDSLHGDLGIVGADDVAILLSKSGGSDELLGLIGSLQRLGVPIVAITGDADSMLTRAAVVVLDAAVAEEACPFDLAPTSSTAVALALGDALALALVEVKGVRMEDFAALHPGGSIGRRLLLRVRDVMVVPGRILSPSALMRDAVVSLAHDRGLAIVAEAGRLAGVLTTGDLTRLADRDAGFIERPVAEVMNRAPRTAAPDDLAGAAVGVMQRHGVMVLPVVAPKGDIVGVVHLHDLLRAGAV